MKPLLRRKNAEQRRAGIGAYIRKRPPGVEPAKINKFNLIELLVRNVPVINAKGSLRRSARRKQLLTKPVETLAKMIKNKSINNTRKGLPHSNLTREQLVQEFRKHNKKTNISLLSNQNLVNYLAAKHFKKNRIQNLNTRNNSIRLQEGGTCWFHSIINGWLLSYIGREVLKARTLFTEPNPELDNFCPVRSKLPSYFWKYIKFELTAPKDHIWANVRLQLKYHERNLIHATGLRKIPDTPNGGWVRDVLTFMDFIVPGNWSKNPGKDVCIMYYGASRKEIHAPPPGYRVSHAYIELSSSNPNIKSGHAITGYVTKDGKYKIVDSNNVRPVSCDWFHGVRELEIYASLREYTVTTKEGFYVTRTVVFIKENPSDKLFLPWQKLISP